MTAALDLEMTDAPETDSRLEPPPEHDPRALVPGEPRGLPMADRAGRDRRQR